MDDCRQPMPRATATGRVVTSNHCCANVPMPREFPRASLRAGFVRKKRCRGGPDLGQCLTDAARGGPSPARRSCVCRYAADRTYSKAIVAAICAGGSIKTSVLFVSAPGSRHLRSVTLLAMKSSHEASHGGKMMEAICSAQFCRDRQFVFS